MILLLDTLYSNCNKVLKIILLMVFSSLGMVGQDKFDITHYDLSDGLSHNHVTSLLEHSDGLVWIGSKDGLDMFDGYEFYKVDLPKHTSLMYGSVGPFIYSMRELHDGKIFMDFLQHPNSPSKIFYIYDAIMSKTEILDTSILKSLKFKECKSQEPSRHSNYEILGSDCKGNFIIKNNSTSSIYLLYADGSQLELSNEFVNEDFQIGFLGDDYSRIIYAKSTNGFLKIVPFADPFDKFLHEDINDWDFGPRTRAICPIDGTEILVSIEDDNLKKVNLETKKIEDLVFRDLHNDTLMSTSYLTGIIKESDSIFYATALEFLFLKLNINRLEAEHILKDGNFMTYLQHHSIRLRNGDILIAGGNESEFILYQFDPKSGQIDSFKVTQNFIKSTVHSSFVLEGKDSSIWAGTDYGLLHLDLETKEVLAFYRSKKEADLDRQQLRKEHFVLNGKGVISLHEDEAGLIWIGLDKGGLDILNPNTNIIENYSEERGLSGNTVAGIVEHNGNFWVSTYTGLSVIDTVNQNIAKFGKEDGLTHQEFNRLSMAKTPEGKIIFGGMNGINSFDPDEVLNTKIDLKIQLSEVEYYEPDGKTLAHDTWPFEDNVNISIPANNKACAFKYFLSDFRNPSSSVYEYKLDKKSLFGFQESGDWRSNGNRNEIRFDLLEPGDQILYVRGKTKEGLVSESFTVDLHVKNYFYKRLWFILVVMIFLSTLLYLFYRMKLYQVRNTERIRAKLSSDLHDNVGSLLSGVAYQMELLEHSVDKEQIGLVKKVALSSRKAMRQMRNIVWALDSRNSNYQNLADRFKEHAEEILLPSDVLFSIKLDSIIAHKELDANKKHELLSIFQEFLANTLKHSNASKVNASIELKGNRVHFSLKDNGTATMEVNRKKSGQGLKNMKMRTKNIHGNINISNQSGFLVNIDFPLKN